MTITNLTNRPLTDGELKALHTMADSIIPGYEDAVVFALISNECIIPMNRRRHPDQESQIAEAKNIADSASSFPPDFSTGVWDDGTGYVYMSGETGRVFRCVDNLSGGKQDFAHINLGIAIEARQMIMEACEDVTVIALAYCEKGED